MSDTNINMLQTVANGLSELKDEVVFIGGVVAELYATDPAVSDIRPTNDVDCVIEISSRLKFANLEENLRSKGFVNDLSDGAPICRWVYKDIKVDVMPSDTRIFGFSNVWYAEEIENRVIKILPDKTEIFVFPPEYYLASKFEAHNGRGSDDLRQSHDFEDIVYILGNTLGILAEIKNANQSVKTYLKEECQKLLTKDGLSEGLGCALSFESWDDRPEIIEELIQSIAEIE